jgi:hypothetical protein
MLVTRRVILFPMLFADSVGMGGEALQFVGSLMIFVM